MTPPAPSPHTLMSSSQLPTGRKTLPPAEPLADPPPPYSSIFTDVASEETKRPPHSSPVVPTRPGPLVDHSSSVHYSSDCLPLNSTPTEAVARDDLIYGKMLELEGLVSSVQHTLNSQTRAYHDVSHQLFEINEALGHLRSTPTEESLVPGSDLDHTPTDTAELSALLAQTNLSYTSTPLPESRRSVTHMQTGELAESPSSTSTPSNAVESPVRSKMNSTSEVNTETASDNEAEQTYTRINTMLQNLIDSASSALQNKDPVTLDPQDLARAEEMDEYLGAYQKQLTLVQPAEPCTPTQGSPVLPPAADPSPVPTTEALVDVDYGSEDDSDGNVEVQFWCKVVKKSRNLQESLAHARTGHKSTAGTKPAVELLTEHQLQNALLVPLLAAGSPSHRLPSPFTPSPLAKNRSETSPAPSAFSSVKRIRRSIRQSLVGTDLALFEPGAPVDTSAPQSLVPHGSQDTTSPPTQALAASAQGPTALARSPSAKDTARNFVTMMYWTLLFTLGAILLDAFICNIAGHQVLGMIDHIQKTQTEQDEKDETPSNNKALESGDESSGLSDLDQPCITEISPAAVAALGEASTLRPVGQWFDQYVDNLIIEEIED
ncbi:hypothetical protein H4R34_004889 [Dimargaris verticillata]|uniref:Uncharacterized protein n=1 Tax=Dimargaris verticillata TaxID=2761393 RepID=A0A9W8E7N8_9FUNG|nr:hypothetical protein H4R34_004889 [Dimargaris verticillata]